eukprot:gnl/Hemi2/19430_TR6452_c0_g1_i1.p1 gnl/Hemi2/19430_TR6452_c0_g1~~gnl/Hemi2/19430_TR6452_c0_g1_i1.p1  ORF type:complete len:505 (-),score=108.12 gnl/Hemi2/19430_TR6452_c0_g1_i1:111-1625(-)
MLASSERRLRVLQAQLAPDSEEGLESNPCSSGPTTATSQQPTGKNTVTVTDDRTGKSVVIPIERDTISATALNPLNLRLYDPAYQNTAVCKSAICYIDGDKGILEYRGYPIEELAEKSNFLEVSYLIINGELPNSSQLNEWTHNIQNHTFIHENMKALLSNFRYDSHPMGMLISSISALSTFYPEANPALQGEQVLQSASARNKQIFRILGKVPTLAACAYRHRIGREYNNPNAQLGYTENFLHMMDKLTDDDQSPHPVIAHALDVLFLLHAEHELNCSTAAMRHIASSGVDPYTAVAGAAAALYGPLHGGANELVLRMLEKIGSKDKIPAFIEGVKQKKEKLFGFGHRIYKNYDPRAKIVRKIAYEVFEVLGKEPLIDLAIKLEEAALTDDYFISRKLYPNVDFYSGLIFRSMGFPTDMFPVLFTIPRTAGWLAHWLESREEPNARIWRPRQVYVGSERRAFVPIDERPRAQVRVQTAYHSPMNRRRTASNRAAEGQKRRPPV